MDDGKGDATDDVGVAVVIVTGVGVEIGANSAGSVTNGPTDVLST